MPKLLGFRNLCSTILTYHFLELFSKVYICLSTMIVLFNSHSCFFLHIVTMLRVLETWTLTIIRELNVSNSAYQSPVIALKYIDNSRCLYCALASGNFYFVLIKVSLFWPNRQFILVGTVLGWELRQKPQKEDERMGAAGSGNPMIDIGVKRGRRRNPSKSTPSFIRLNPFDS